MLGTATASWVACGRPGCLGSRMDMNETCSVGARDALAGLERPERVVGNPAGYNRSNDAGLPARADPEKMSRRS